MTTQLELAEVQQLLIKLDSDIYSNGSWSFANCSTILSPHLPHSGHLDWEEDWQGEDVAVTVEQEEGEADDLWGDKNDFLEIIERYMNEKKIK